MRTGLSSSLLSVYLVELRKSSLVQFEQDYENASLVQFEQDYGNVL